MTKAASDKPVKVSTIKYEPPSRVDINLEKHPHMDGHNVGDTVHFSGKGKVASIHKSDDSSTMGIDLHSIKKLSSNIKKNGPFDHGQADHPV